MYNRGSLSFYDYAIQIKHIAQILEENPDNLNPVFFSQKEFDALKDLVFSELSNIKEIQEERVREFRGI